MYVSKSVCVCMYVCYACLHAGISNTLLSLLSVSSKAKDNCRCAKRMSSPRIMSWNCSALNSPASFSSAPPSVIRSKSSWYHRYTCVCVWCVCVCVCVCVYVYICAYTYTYVHIRP